MRKITIEATTPEKRRLDYVVTFTATYDELKALRNVISYSGFKDGLLWEELSKILGDDF